MIHYCERAKEGAESILKKRILNLVSIASLFCLALAPCLMSPAAGMYVMVSPQMTLTTSNSNAFQIGAINVKNDMYNIMGRSTIGGRLLTLDSSGASLNEIPTGGINPTTPANYPAQVGEVNGLNSYDPSASTRWAAVDNNSASKGNYSISLEKMKETLNDGDKKLVTINNSLGVNNGPDVILNLEMNLASDTAYILLVTDVLSTFHSRVQNLYVLDPQGNYQSLGAPPTFTAITSPEYFITYVAKFSGTHEFFFRLSVPVSPVETIVQFELHSISETGLSPGNLQVFGDDPHSSINTIFGKQFKYWAFTIDVSAGDWYSYYFAQQASSANIWRCLATPGAYSYAQQLSGTGQTLGETYGIALANGKVMVIAVETNWQQLVTYRVLFHQGNPTTIDIPAIQVVSADPNSLISLHFSVPNSMLFRLRILSAAGSPVPVVSSINLKLRDSFLIQPTDLAINVQNNTVFTNGSTEVMDQVMFLQQGEYYCYLDNTANARQMFVSVMTMITADNPAVPGSITMWNGNFSKGAWQPFNDVLNFQNNLTFSDLGKGTGAMVPQAWQFTVNQLSYLQFRFAIRLYSNPALTKGTDWRGSFKYAVLGANANYTECSNIRDVTSNANNFDTVLATGNSNDLPTVQTPVMFLPGTYFLLMGFSYWVNQSKANPSLFPYVGSVTLSLTVQNYSAHIGYLNYAITSTPITHAYSYQANTFRSVNYLNFTSKFKNATSFASTNGEWLKLNGVQYNYGYLINVTGATAFNWTQLIVYYNNMTGLAPGGATPGPAEINTGGISIIYNPMWGPSYTTTGQFYYNQKLTWQPSGTNTGGFQGQNPGHTLGNVTSGQLSMEFGVYASSFLIWIYPQATGNANMNGNQTLCIRLSQFNTPTIAIVTTQSGSINWVLIIVIVAVAAGAVVVVAVLYKVKKNSPLGLKYALRRKTP